MGRAIFESPQNFSGAYRNQLGNLFKGGFKSRYVGGLSQVFGAHPSGYSLPHAFLLPLKSGAISSYTLSSGVISTNVNLIPAYNLEGTSSIFIDVTNAQLDQIVSFIASATLTLAKVDAALAAAAGLFANGSQVISLNSAQLGAIFSVLTDGQMVISSDSTLTALANMEAEAGGPTELSPEGLAAALLNAMLMDYNEPGSVGEALNNVGASSNPWSSDLSTNKTAGTFGAHVQKLLTQAKFIGLK